MRRALLLLAALFVASTAHAGFLGVGANPLNPSSVTNVTVTAPTVPSGMTNCILHATIGKGNNTTVLATGWTHYQQCTASGQTMDYLWKAAVGSEGGTYNFNGWSSSSVYWAQIQLFCGENTTAPIDQSSCVSHSSSTSNATPSITPTAADEDGIMSWGTINAGLSTFPVGPFPLGVDPTNGTIFAMGVLIGNASAQQYTLTSINPGNTFGEATFFTSAVNNRTWGIRSIIPTGGTGSTGTFNAPINIGTARERIDVFLDVQNTQNPLTSLPSGSWTCPQHQVYNGATATLWHCVDSAPSSADTTYSFGFASSVSWGVLAIDQVNTTGTDAVVTNNTAGGASSITTSTLTTANNNEPIFSFWDQFNANAELANGTTGVFVFHPPLNFGGLYGFGRAAGFEIQGTAGASTGRTSPGCTSNCSGNAWTAAAVANIMATPVPSGGGGGQGQGQGQGQGSRGNVHPPHGGGRAGSGSAWRPRWAGGY